MANTTAPVIDLYTAPTDVKEIIFPGKVWDSKPITIKVRPDKEAVVYKDVFVEEGKRKIQRPEEECCMEDEDERLSQERESKASAIVESTAESRSQHLSRSHSQIDIEDDALFEEDVFYVEPQPEFPGPFDPERVRMLYARACTKLKVVPSSCFKHGLNSGRVIARHQGLGPLGAKALAISLLTNLTVTELHVPNNKLGPDGMRAMSSLIHGNEIIKVLDISDNDLGREGAKVLAAAIRENDSIMQIGAAGNKFDDKTGRYFEEAFKVNSMIKQVDLSRNMFSELGTVHLAKGLEENDAVTHLDLSYNHIRRLGIKGIAKMLLNNSSLMQLDLSWNGIDIDGAYQLGQGLNQNTMLSVLNVTGCRINAACLLKMLGQMKDNRTLKTLQFPENPLTNADLTLFLRALESVPDMVLNFIDAGSITVSQDLLDLQKKLAKERPGFMLTYRGILSIRDCSKNMMETMDLSGGDPLEVIISYARQKNLRLLDIFARFDVDKSGTMTRQELIMGVADAGIPLSIQQLDRLVAKLDKDGDGEVDFGELLEGYRKFMRNLHKQGKVARKVLKGEQEMFPGLAGAQQEEKEEKEEAEKAESAEKGRARKTGFLLPEGKSPLKEKEGKPSQTQLHPNASLMVGGKEVQAALSEIDYLNPTDIPKPDVPDDFGPNNPVEVFDSDTVDFPDPNTLDTPDPELQINVETAP